MKTLIAAIVISALPLCSVVAWDGTTEDEKAIEALKRMLPGYRG